MTQQTKLRRRFLGVIITAENYKEVPESTRRLEEKHLRAYLRGFNYFKYGKTKEGDEAWYPVKQEYYNE